MFSKAFLSPKSTAQKNISYTSPKSKDSSLRTLRAANGKSPLRNDSFDMKGSFYAKENVHFDNESLSSTQLGSTIIGSDPISSMTFVSGGATGDGREGVHTIFNEKYCRKVLEEMVVLRKELEEKNSMIDKLMKENGTLRHEMEEFVNAVDDAREYIDTELKECNQRIVNLEAEVHEVRQENKHYKEELERRTFKKDMSKQKDIAGYLEKEADGFYSNAQRSMEDFYFRLNEQLTEFMCSSQKQHQDFNKSLHKKIHDGQDHSVEKVEQTRTDTSSIMQCSSPLRHSKQGTNAVRNFFEASKSPKTVKQASYFESSKSPKPSHSTPITNKNSSKQNLDNFLSNTTEVTSPSSYSLYNTSPGYASTSQFDKQYEEPTVSVLSEFNRSGKKSTGTIVSPSKGGLLRTKLKSDAILQEMKKRLSGL